MKISRKNIIINFIILFFSILSVNAVAQQEPTLAIGDLAPELQYLKWLKGKPVDITKGDRIYVVEFWATWCMPCIEAMPHLSELAKKYADRVEFIGCNIKERVGNKPYDSALPNVEKFVTNNSDKMRYNVIIDNNARHMDKKWMGASGQPGIPCTIVVQNNKIVWIGHPVNVEPIIKKLIDGTYNAAEERKSVESVLAVQRAYLNALKEVGEAIKRKDYEGALKLIDNESEKVPAAKSALERMKVEVMLESKGEKEAINYLNQLLNGKSFTPEVTSLAGVLMDKKNLSKETYTYLADYYGAISPKSSSVLDNAATAASLAKNFKAAADYQKQAVELAKLEIKGTSNLNDSTIESYQKKMEDYLKQIR